MKNINEKIGNTNRKLASFVKKGFPFRWGLLMPLTIGASDLDSSYNILGELNSNKAIYSEIADSKDSYSAQKNYKYV